MLTYQKVLPLRTRESKNDKHSTSFLRHYLLENMTDLVYFSNLPPRIYIRSAPSITPQNHSLSPSEVLFLLLLSGPLSATIKSTFRDPDTTSDLMGWDNTKTRVNPQFSIRQKRVFPQKKQGVTIC